ncbi:Alpha/Beta hydrolase protein [Cristinia sonorae]|uniref:Alpha/Beta hydrolase protein n=1 Tax=Cristinia sonorae TaxID=1940300 RepID=A0A8K0XTF6_9AGAR|nr:Alpha/Beta hydrolase protein [Cristinia sonorae]
MPFVDLVAKDDFASLWYSTNTACRNVGGFDPTRPTIVMLHPLHVDSTWLYPQLDDPRLTNKFNIITFDTRITGASVCRFSGMYDLYVAAADIAHAFYHLRIPPAHIFASEVFSYVALRLAALFPDLCLSLTLCNVSAPTEPKVVFEGWEELMRLWCYAEDLESFEHACGLHLSHTAAPDVHPDLADEIVAHYQMNWPPFKRNKLITFAQVILNRTPMNATELAAVRCPVLMCQADKNPIFPVIYAEQLVEGLINVPNGAVLYNVKAAIGFITIFSASIVNKVFSTFLARQPLTRSDLSKPTESLAEFMMSGLRRLAEFTKEPSILTRDPKSPLSFSRVTQEVCRNQEAAVRAYEKGQRRAFSPLSTNGRPMRKYSERKDDWMQIGPDGFSYSGRHSRPAPSENKDKKPSPPPEPPKPAQVVVLEDIDIPLSEPVSSTEQAIARSRRVVVGPVSTVEQQVVKGLEIPANTGKSKGSKTATTKTQQIMRKYLS